MERRQIEGSGEESMMTQANTASNPSHLSKIFFFLHKKSKLVLISFQEEIRDKTMK